MTKREIDRTRKRWETFNQKVNALTVGYYQALLTLREELQRDINALSIECAKVRAKELDTQSRIEAPAMEG